MTLRIASAEVVCILFMLIILASSCNRKEQRSLDRSFFTVLVAATTLGLCFDALSYFLDEGRPNSILLAAANIMAFSMINLCLASFGLYTISIIRRAKHVSYRILYPVFAVCALNIILIVAGYFSGNFFSVEDHHLLYGPWQDPVTIMPVIPVFALTVILLSNTRYLGTRNSLALGSFTAFPLIAASLVVFYPELQLAYIASALSCSVIFTFIRREEINEAHLHEELLHQITVHDTLTGLKNRRGFEAAIDQSADHHKLGIVFCDLNALKYTNDQFGHAAGDDLIRRFADILREVFGGTNDIFRVSGDEFVVMLYDISEADLDGSKNDLNEAIRKNDRIASVGYAYGKSSSAKELIRQAEQEMYDDKNRYYADKGIERRRTRRP